MTGGSPEFSGAQLLNLRNLPIFNLPRFGNDSGIPPSTIASGRNPNFELWHCFGTMCKLMRRRLEEGLGVMLKSNVIVILVLCAYASGQKNSTGKVKETPHSVLTYEVKFEPDTKLETSFGEDHYTAITSEGCDDHGNPYVQVHRAIPPNSNQVLKFDENGTVTFETNKISDIVEPKWIADFASDSELDMLIEGNTHTEQRSKKTDSGEDEVYWETTGEPRYYIARFDADGSYKGALKLDLPFRPMQLSGFSSGNFLVTGPDDRQVTRVAVLDSSGQLLRDIEFAKERQQAAEKTFKQSFGMQASSETAALMLSLRTSFFPYQSDVLYVRGGTGAPIYEINPGGEAHPVKIKSREGYSVEYMIPTDRNWFIVSTESGKGFDSKRVVDELSPSNGELLAHYVIEGAGREKAVADGQSDVACFHAGEFVSVRHQAGKLTVLHGTPTDAKNSTASSVD